VREQDSRVHSYGRGRRSCALRHGFGVACTAEGIDVEYIFSIKRIVSMRVAGTSDLCQRLDQRRLPTSLLLLDSIQVAVGSQEDGSIDTRAGVAANGPLEKFLQAVELRAAAPGPPPRWMLFFNSCPK